MEPPSLRELELETLLRERDTQVTELSDEVNQLRKHLSTQPAPSRSDPISLPPALLALLQPYVNGQPPSGTQGSTSTTMTAALMQRARVLQDENDELYDLLRIGETGKLKEEVRSLQRAVTKLERALKESHGVISSLSDELDKSYTEFMSRTQEKPDDSYHRESRSPPRNTSRSAHTNSNHNSSLKPIPTGPRAQKKPRLSESQPSPARSNVTPPPMNSNSNVARGNSARAPRRERSPRGESRRAPTKDARMDVDEDVKRPRQASPDKPREKRERDRDRERERDRDRDKQKERDRARGREDREPDREGEHHKERERDRSRRNGTQGGRGTGGAGSSGRKGPRGHASHDSGDRTLAERMGL